MVGQGRRGITDGCLMGGEDMHPWMVMVEEEVLMVV